ncbi:metallophosphoesterase [Niallia sp. NCCP-28]|uniref:metallophosphoesterase n=1 Tax=Niallia sp. NCCP-28 TaxID=2934712 RepID=UPI00208C710D|nr:metallophosphoesterase [Niallia sp. NCCP-28]GKU81029.1 metallophosphoesterase [Niallia sp. NCCP-28]
MLPFMLLLAVFVLFIGVLLLVKMHQQANENTVKYELIYFPDFPRSFQEVSLFFISDIHKRTVADSLINEVKDIADIVIIGGDLTEKGVSFEQIRKNIQKLKLIGHIYFVWGNNDYEVDSDRLKQLFAEEKVSVLDNKSITFNSEGGEKWSLVGIEDYSMELDDLEGALAQTKEDVFKILLSHNPKIMEKIKEEHKISFVLSGHTHGGQIRIFGIGPYEIGKTKVIGNTTILVSNGYGTTKVPLRLGAKPETHLIKIKNKLDQ